MAEILQKICTTSRNFRKMGYVIKIDKRILWYHMIILDQNRIRNLDPNPNQKREVIRNSSKTIAKLKYPQIPQILELRIQVITVKKLTNNKNRKI